MEPGILLGVGNPLLDLTVDGNKRLLDKYKLQADNAVLASEDQLPIYKELLESRNVKCFAGGSVQNSLRVCQWILGTPKVCVFMGSVGKDKYSQILEKTAMEDGVEVKYQYQENYPTGTCAVIITNHEGNKRSLCANLAAAEKFTIDHILKPENYEYVEKAKFYYISGFFLTVSLETVKKLGEIASEANKQFVTNLSAPFICDLFKDSLMAILPHTDIVFGNETEARVFGEKCFGLSDMGAIIRKIGNLPKSNPKRKRIVIITNGSYPVTYLTDDKLKQVAVPKITRDRVIDTNGAGDAFAGGFLSQLILGKSIEECIECGIWAAGHIIQHSGCVFDKNVRYKG